jgi:hypothetical protein
VQARGGWAAEHAKGGDAFVRKERDRDELLIQTLAVRTPFANMFASCRRSAASLLGNSLSRSLSQPQRFQTPCTGPFVTNSSITPTPVSLLSISSKFCFPPSVFCLQTRAASNGNVNAMFEPLLLPSLLRLGANETEAEEERSQTL